MSRASTPLSSQTTVCIIVDQESLPPQEPLCLTSSTCDVCVSIDIANPSSLAFIDIYIYNHFHRADQPCCPAVPTLEYRNARRPRVADLEGGQHRGSRLASRLRRAGAQGGSPGIVPCKYPTELTDHTLHHRRPGRGAAASGSALPDQQHM